MSTLPHKNCVNLSRVISESHDKLYEPFKRPAETTLKIRQQLTQLAQEAFFEKTTYLIFDDSQISKPHAKQIEDLAVGFDGSISKPELGLQFVSALLSDGDIKLPIDIAPYMSKKVASSRFIAKSDIAAQLYHVLMKLFDIGWVLADAHYATKTFLPQLLKKWEEVFDENTMQSSRTDRQDRGTVENDFQAKKK